MKRILFVCMGNICRSPTGEGIFRKHVQDNGLEANFFIDSAGTIGYHAGKPADARMRAAASKKGYQLDSISRQVTADDMDDFDLIVAMDRNNLADLQRISAGPDAAPLRLLSDFLGDEWPTDVPDPYYGGDAGFHYVVEMIEAACIEILQQLKD